MKTRFGIVAGIVALLLLCVLPALALADDTTGRGTGYLATPTVSPLTSDEQMLLDLINKERTKRGLVKLRYSAKLTDAARAHSAEMATEAYFAHDSLSGEGFSQRLVRFGYAPTGCRYWKVGEDIAYGTGLYSSPVYTVYAWMHSPAHRAVILTACFRDIGVGIAVAEGGYGGVDTPVTFATMDVGRRIKF